jgi:hypothetical protein
MSTEYEYSSTSSMQHLTITHSLYATYGLHSLHILYDILPLHHNHLHYLVRIITDNTWYVAALSLSLSLYLQYLVRSRELAQMIHRCHVVALVAQIGTYTV